MFTLLEGNLRTVRYIVNLKQNKLVTKYEHDGECMT
jgi:uncharacterized protein YehS (DUF1456 family)